MKWVICLLKQVFAMGILYAAFVFIALEPLPKDWNATGRVAFVMLSLLCWLAVWFEAAERWEELEDEEDEFIR